jgi:pyruvate/2-oxoacid:ferredoxin oxidoreductase beta subunit
MKAINARGFRFIEVLSPCTSRVSSRMGWTAAEHIKLLMKNTIPIDKINKYPPEEIRKKYVIGVFKDEDEPGYLDRFRRWGK